MINLFFSSLSLFSEQMQSSFYFFFLLSFSLLGYSHIFIIMNCSPIKQINLFFSLYSIWFSSYLLLLIANQINQFCFFPLFILSSTNDFHRPLFALCLFATFILICLPLCLYSIKILTWCFFFHWSMFYGWFHGCDAPVIPDDYIIYNIHQIVLDCLATVIRQFIVFRRAGRIFIFPILLRHEKSVSLGNAIPTHHSYFKISPQEKRLNLRTCSDQSSSFNYSFILSIIAPAYSNEWFKVNFDVSLQAHQLGESERDGEMNTLGELSWLERENETNAFSPSLILPSLGALLPSLCVTVPVNILIIQTDWAHISSSLFIHLFPCELSLPPSC